MSSYSHQTEMVQKKLLNFTVFRFYISHPLPHPPLSPTCLVWKPLLDKDNHWGLNT